MKQFVLYYYVNPITEKLDTYTGSDQYLIIDGRYNLNSCIDYALTSKHSIFMRDKKRATHIKIFKGDFLKNNYVAISDLIKL